MPEEDLKKSIKSYVMFNHNKYKGKPVFNDRGPMELYNIINEYKYRYHLIFSFAEWLHSISPCFIVPLHEHGRVTTQFEPYWCGYSREDPSICGIHDRQIITYRVDDNDPPIKIITKHIPSIFI